MGTFVLFAVPFSLLGWFIYTMLRYTNESVGEESPLKTVVVYQYDEWDFLKWTNTPVMTFLCMMQVWACWVALSNIGTATNIWHYVLTISCVVLCVAYFYLLNKLFSIEKRFWTIINDTSLVLDPATKSITVQRSGTSTVLTASSITLIEMHVIGQSSKVSYHYFRFVDHDGDFTLFYDYGKGLRFAIDEYFKDVPVKWVTHKSLFKIVSFA